MTVGNVYFGLNEPGVMHFLIFFTGILLGVYSVLIYYYHRIWDQIPVHEGTYLGLKPSSDRDFSIRLAVGDLDDFPVGLIKVSVIIPARNEEKRIGNCLVSLLCQSYPSTHTEILVVNDFSSDDTAACVSGYAGKCKLLNLSDYVSDPLNAYKKKALEIGIAQSQGELIICTDADCRMGPDWILTIVSAYVKYNLVFLAAPVKIISDGSALSVFQALDFISLQGITGAAVYKNLYPMCNGANLAYSRKAFEAVGGFADIDHIASGDDMLLLKKIQGHFPGKCGFIKDPLAIVYTAPAENIRAFFSQRIRWASKISHYKHPATFITLGLVYLLNAGLLVLFLSCFFYGHWRWLLILVAFKTISEYFFVSKVATFFCQQSLMRYFPFCQPFHIAYTVIAGSFGSFGKYNWKNRQVK